MEKQQFVDLLGRFSKSSENEALNVMALKEYFPYCQVFHTLSARATKDHRFLEQKEALQLAAVYAADRGVLKQAMTDDTLQVGRSLPPYISLKPSAVTVSERFTEEMELPIPKGVDYSDEVANAAPTAIPEQDLTRARHTDAGTLNFQHRAQQIQAEAAAAAEAQGPQDTTPVNEMETSTVSESSAAVFAAGELASETTVEPTVEAVSEPTPAAATADAGVPGVVIVATETVEKNVADQVISDLERLNQLKHNFEALFEANKASILLRDAALTVGATPAEELGRIQQARQKRIAELVSSLDPELNGSDAQTAELNYGMDTKNILEEIKNNKQPLEPENQKQKDQLQMIDDFIKTQPNLAGRDKALNAPADLSTIKTGEFSDNIVSETLVDILVKQGKKDKAVEVLKKLIWKFPQKKAYFAAQIEDLKK